MADMLIDEIGNSERVDTFSESENDPIRLRDLRDNHVLVRTNNIALASLQLALTKEASVSEKLRSFSKGVKDQLKNVDLLLNLSSQLTSLPDDDSVKITEKMRDIIETLKRNNIDIWKGGETLNKNQLNELKAHISSQVDKLRTEIQTTVSTEIQPKTSYLQSIMDIVKHILRSYTQLIEKFCRLPR